MPKYNTIGYVAKSQKDPKKSYIKITKDVSLTKGAIVQLFEPRKSDKDTEEKFNEVKQWKRFDLVQISDD